MTSLRGGAIINSAPFGRPSLAAEFSSRRRQPHATVCLAEFAAVSAKHNITEDAPCPTAMSDARGEPANAQWAMQCLTTSRPRHICRLKISFLTPSMSPAREDTISLSGR